MKISTKGRYGLTIMMELARNTDNKPISLKSIAQTHNLSEHYLEQLAAPLKNAGLVRSVRGAYGGYMLAKKPTEISAAQIIRALEGPIQPVEAMDDEEPAKKHLWMQIRDAVKEVLESTSLESLANYKEESEEMQYMFYI